MNCESQAKENPDKKGKKVQQKTHSGIPVILASSSFQECDTSKLVTWVLIRDRHIFLELL